MTETIFIIIAALAMLLLYFGTGKAKTTLFVFGLWSILVTTATLAGFLAGKPARLVAFVVISVLLAIFCFRKTKTNPVDSRALLAIHVLRIAVEWVLYQLFLQKQIPELMTFKGWNFDIVTGITAAVLLLFQRITHKKINRQLFIAWNIAGLILLTLIVALAILSAPLPVQQFAFDQPNIAVIQFPYCLLPTIIVPIVYLSHLLLLREAKPTRPTV